MDFLVEFGKAENISKIFFDKYNVMEQHSLDHKKCYILQMIWT